MLHVLQINNCLIVLYILYGTIYTAQKISSLLWFVNIDKPDSNNPSTNSTKLDLAGLNITEILWAVPIMEIVVLFQEHI